jgi:hypothetical protein
MGGSMATNKEQLEQSGKLAFEQFAEQMGSALEPVDVKQLAADIFLAGYLVGCGDMAKRIKEKLVSFSQERQ